MEDLNQNPVDNGVDVKALLEARTVIEGAPETGQAVWRARCEWQEGVHSRTTIDGFYLLCDEQKRSCTHVIEADHPELFAASDHGATPVEIVLSGLASCLTAGIASVAQNRGIQLRRVRSTVEGDMDMAGILGISDDVRNGFSAIRVSFEVDADASPEDIAALVAQSQKRSAVFDIITNPTTVHVSVETAVERQEHRNGNPH
ncbi:MAG: OsmC family protein [Pseudomonadota bacterium]